MSSHDTATQPGAPETAGAGRNLALATAAFAVCFSAWGMLAPLAPKVQEKLDLSDTETAVMIAIPVVLGSLLRIPLGWLTDKLGGRAIFTVMLAYSAGAALLIGFATSYVALLGAGFLLGVAGASFAVGVPFVADWYPSKRQGFALGVYGAGNIGTAVAAFSIPFLYTRFGQLSAGIAFGAVLGAFGGAFTAPKISVTPGLGVEVIVIAFAVVAIGGMGSIPGALIGSLIVGLGRAAAVHLFPQVELFVVYAVMALVLAIRPEGLFSRMQARKI